MSRVHISLSELELELKRQDQSFQTVRDALTALGSGARLSIPEHVLEELDAAFTPPAIENSNDWRGCTRLRA